MDYCKSCKFLAKSYGMYECRRYAPRPVTTAEVQNFNAVFPVVDVDSDWCGEFQSRHKQKGNNAENEFRKRWVVKKGVRYEVLQRDGFACKKCGRSPEIHGVELHVDHITPKSQGGTNDISNLRTLCGDCNRGKSDKVEERTTPLALDSGDSPALLA